MAIELGKGLTVKSLVIGLLGTIFLSALNVTNNAFYQFTVGAHMPTAGNVYTITNGFMYGVGLFFVIALIAALINKASGKNAFTGQELAVIGMMFAWSGVLNNYYTTNITWWFQLRAPGIAWEPDPIKTYNVLPAILRGGSPEAVRDYWLSILSRSTWNINWSIVGPPLGWSILFGISFLLMTLFFSNFIRRRWIEMEEVAFPTAQFQADIISATQKDENGIIQMFKNKWLLVGIVISFIVYGSLTFVIYPLSPDRPLGGFKLPGGINYWGITPDFTPLAILPWVPLVLNIHPYIVGWGFLIPTDVILGFLVGWVGFWIIMPLLLNGLGVPGWTTFTTGTTAKTVWWHNGSFIFGIMIGLYAVLAAMTLWSSRRFFRPSIGASEDPNAPLSNRINWVGFIGFLVLMLAALAVLEARMLSTTLFVLVTLFLALGAVRMLAESGGNLGGPEVASNSYFFLGALIGPLVAWYTGGFSDPTSTAAYITFDLLGWVWFLTQSTECGIFWPLHGYKLGFLAKTRVKDMFVTIVIAFVVSIVASAIAIPIWLHVLPISGASGTWGKLLVWINGGYLYAINGGYAAANVHVVAFGPLEWTTTLLELIAVGLVVGIIFAVLRAKVPRFPIPLAGLAFGALLGDGLWSCFILVWIIKIIIIRTRGIEPINKIIRPLGVGLLIGYAFWYLMSWLFTIWIFTVWHI